MTQEHIQHISLFIAEALPVHVNPSPSLTRVSPGLAEAHFDPVLAHRRRHYSVDFPAYFLLDVAVLDASGRDAGVVGSGAVEIDRVVVRLGADGAPLHPQGVVAHTIELEVCGTAGTYGNAFWTR